MLLPKHLIKLRSTHPTANISALDDLFCKNVSEFDIKMTQSQTPDKPTPPQSTHFFIDWVLTTLSFV